MENPINRSMNIQALAQAHPEAVVVMAERGLHCVGCHASAVDSVESGAKTHGMSDEEIDAMVAEMNEMVSLRKEELKNAKPAHIDVTEKAAKKLQELMKAEGKDGYSLRVQVVPGGCSGFQYGLDFDNLVTPNDLEFTHHGVKIIIDKDSAAQIPGAKVDYVDGLHGSGFTVENPTAEHKCGCGKSFA